MACLWDALVDQIFNMRLHEGMKDWTIKKKNFSKELNLSDQNFKINF